MVTEINIYIEGGGDNNQTKTKLRQGFSAFLKELVAIARDKRIGWKLVACGSRDSAYDDFCTGIKSSPNVFHVLLVDSEEAVKTSSMWSHLKQRDPKWNCPAGINDDHCFLMEQSMETWLIADRDALARYYKQGFNEKALPDTQNIETVNKKLLMKKLIAATEKSKSKGPYHKTQHGFDILAMSDPKVIRKSASHCKRLFDHLSAEMGARIPND